MTHPPRGCRICGLTACAGGEEGVTAKARKEHLTERFLNRDCKL